MSSMPLAAPELEYVGFWLRFWLARQATPGKLAGTVVVGNKPQLKFDAQ